MADAVRDLRALMASRHGLLVVDTRDEASLDFVVSAAAEQLKVPVWHWTAATGLSVPGGATPAGTRDPEQAISFIRDLDRPLALVMLDAAPVLDDPVAARRLKELASTAMANRTVILTGVGSDVPATLDGVAVMWTLPIPDRDQMRDFVGRVVATLPSSGWRVELSDVDALVDAVVGLTPREAERVILRQAAIDGTLDDADTEAAHRARAELMSDGPLDLIDPDVTFDDVGGLAALKEWLRLRGRGFEPDARAFGLDPPRGVLLAGVPGCGKSLVARAIAGTWNMALAALDTGRLHGSLVGESEQRLNQALLASEAMTPVVLWIDEIEKAFGSTDEHDGGVSSRVLGVLLRWLQDRPDGIFVVATCNDVTALPPEVARRGRFDELFFVDLPDPLERAAILSYHLGRRHRDPAAFDLPRLAAESNGFSGSEIESALTSALYVAYSGGAELTTDGLVTEFRQTVPLSVTRAEAISDLRHWAAGRARPAGGWPPPGTAV